MSNIGSVGTVNVFTGKPCACGHGGWCNCPSPAAQRSMPYLAVPRGDGMTFEECQAAMGNLGSVSRPVRTEVEILREQLDAAKAELSLTKLCLAQAQPPEPAPVPNVMTRAISRWPGSQGFIQGIRWRGSL